MAIRRVKSKPEKVKKSSQALNATIQSIGPQRLQQHSEIFRSHLTTAEDTDELVRAIISQRTAKHLVVFYLDEEHRLLAYTILTDGPLSLPKISQRDYFKGRSTQEPLRSCWLITIQRAPRVLFLKT